MPPFTHWFSMQTVGGKALYDDFHKAHPAGEDYGPIPGGARRQIGSGTDGAR